MCRLLSWPIFSRHYALRRFIAHSHMVKQNGVFVSYGVTNFDGLLPKCSLDFKNKVLLELDSWLTGRLLTAVGWIDLCFHFFVVPHPVVQLSSKLWEVAKITKDDPIINAVSLHWIPPLSLFIFRAPKLQILEATSRTHFTTESRNGLSTSGIFSDCLSVVCCGHKKHDKVDSKEAM